MNTLSDNLFNLMSCFILRKISKKKIYKIAQLLLKEEKKEKKVVNGKKNHNFPAL